MSHPASAPQLSASPNPRAGTRILWGIAALWLLFAAAVLTRHLYSETSVAPAFGQEQAFGDDTINFWAAPRLALAGRVGDVYDRRALHAFQEATLGRPMGLYEYSYPPVTILMTLPLGMLPYFVACAVWLVGGFAAFAAVLRRAWPRATNLAVFFYALAFPATLLNFYFGQIGSWTAAVFGAALVLVSRRPTLAGALFGLLVIKPHLAVLVPIALAASGRWRALAACAAVAAALLLASAALGGSQPWVDYLAYMSHFRQHTLEGQEGFWRFSPTVFSMLRLFGAPIAVAYAGQGIAALAAIATVATVWRSRAPQPGKNATLVMATLFVSPYVMTYDLVMTAFVPVWLLSDLPGSGSRRYAVLACALLAIAPVWALFSILVLNLGLGCLALLPAVALAVHRSVAAVRVETGRAADDEAAVA